MYETVLKVLREHKLNVKITKCEFSCRKLAFLGHIISDEGISPNPHKIEVIVNWPTPETMRDVQGFVGMTSFYRKFAKGFSTVTAPFDKFGE